jgi:succinate dehydrogenase/fumarate reductase flavoprotein subunit
LGESASVSDWDVVVVGGGGTGLAAAAEAASLGCRVVVLEKNSKPGGSTSWSVGAITATNSPLQKRAGIQDSADWHFEDLAKHAGALAPRDNTNLRRILVDQCTDALEWLMSLGVVFVGPMPEPPHRVSRMHNVVPNSKSFAYHLARHCRRLGVEIRTRTRAKALVIEHDRVVAVECDTKAGKHRFAAKRAVVLASGDYSADRELKAHFARPEVVNVEAVNQSATGDGHKLALALGAKILNGDIVRGPIMRFVPPKKDSILRRLPPSTTLARFMAWSYRFLPQSLLRPFMMGFLTTALGPSPKLFEEGAILVNLESRRFTDELTTPGDDVPKQPYKIAFIVFDRRVAEKFSAWPYYLSTAPGISYAYLADYRRNRADIYHQGKTIGKLAESMGVPSGTLEKTVSAFNASQRGARPEFGPGPYYALGPLKSYCVFADGGLAVSERLEVLRADGTPIPGLFAGGSVGQGGLLLEGHGHHLGWAFVSGRIAGRNAAKNLPIKGSGIRGQGSGTGD